MKQLKSKGGKTVRVKPSYHTGKAIVPSTNRNKQATQVSLLHRSRVTMSTPDSILEGTVRVDNDAARRYEYYNGTWTETDHLGMVKIYLGKGGYGYSRDINPDGIDHQAPLEGKGVFGERCNVTSCQQEDSAFFWNWGTSKYYCFRCACQLAEANNPKDPNELYDPVRERYRIVDQSVLDKVNAAVFQRDSEHHAYALMKLSELADAAANFRLINPFHVKYSK